MSTVGNPTANLESGRGGRRQRRRRRRRRRPSVSGSSETTTTTDGSLCFSDSDRSATGGGGSLESSVTDYLSDGVDLERGDWEVKAHSGSKEERECRICHLKLVGGWSGDQGSGGGAAIELGCCCKGDLAAAHKQCAETWFKIRGNTTCEICGVTALNVVGEPTNEANGVTAIASSAAEVPAAVAESRNFWHGRRVLNTLLACMVFAFVISWLFHFNVLS